MTAYFLHGRFAGYTSGSLLAACGFGTPDVIPSASTAAGLRIGDGIAQARRIYGSAFVVLLSQGGSWRVTTSTGWSTATSPQSPIARPRRPRGSRT